MKATIKNKKEIDVRYLKVDAGVRYWEDADVNGEPDIDLFESKGEQQGRCNKVVEWLFKLLLLSHCKCCYSLLPNYKFGRTGNGENRLEDLKTAITRTIGKYKKRGELNTLPSVFYMNNDGELRCLFDNS